MNQTETSRTDGRFDAAGDPAVEIAVRPPLRYDLRILSALRRIMQQVDRYSKRLAGEFGVTVPQLLCLLRTDELGPLTVKDLAAELSLNPSTVVGIVDRLEAHGYVLRERSVRDRRRVHVALTDAGREVVSRSPSPLQDALAGAIDNLPELERATIALSLEKIAGLMVPAETPAEGRDALAILESSPDLQSPSSHSTPISS